MYVLKNPPPQQNDNTLSCNYRNKTEKVRLDKGIVCLRSYYDIDLNN